MVLTDQEQDQILTIPRTSTRRHSLPDDTFRQANSFNFFENQFTHQVQHIDSDCECDWIGAHHHHHRDDGIFHVNPFSWLKNKCIQYETMPPQRFKTILRKTSSENELLLMSNDCSPSEFPIIRRSFSSGLLFGN